MNSDQVLEILHELQRAQNEIDAKYRAVSLLTGMTQAELRELGGF